MPFVLLKVFVRKKPTDYLRKTEFVLHLFTRGVRPSRPCSKPHGDGIRIENGVYVQPGARLQKEKKFFILIGRNPLKSPVSEKPMKTNESDFVFIFFH
jgi:hypothetical protein